MKHLMTLREAAEWLNLSPKTLRVQANKGILQAEKMGRDWVVYAAEVTRYAKEHKRG